MASPIPPELEHFRRGHYPQSAFVTVTIQPPYRGRIVIQDEGRGPARVLWECEHDHRTGVEAAACAGQEIGRSGRT